MRKKNKIEEADPNRFKLGKKLSNPDELKVITEYGRFVGDVGDEKAASGYIVCSLEELKQLTKEAEKFTKTKTFKQYKGLFFKHLSPDVTFCIAPKGHPFLKASKESKSK